MVSLRALALTTVAVAALTSAASAADLLPPPPAVDAPAPYPVADTSGWYLRGDVGVGANAIGGAKTNPTGISTLGTGDVGSEVWDGVDVSHSALFDAGVGYQFNNWFRADVTGELRGGASFSGLQVINVASGPDAGYQAADFYKGNLSTALAMVNAYADLGTWYGFTPYVGAGVGVAFNHFSGGLDQGQIGAVGGVGPVSPSGGVLGASTTTNLAWGLMAGVGFNVTRNLKLELGYRYLDYGKFTSGGSSCLSGSGSAGTYSLANCGGKPFSVASKELTSNDFKIGLRYYFDAPTPAPAYEQPLVRKY